MTRGDLTLAVGAAAAVAMVALGLAEPAASTGDTEVPPSAIAVVDGRAIEVEEYHRALAALAHDRREPLDAAVRQRVLERLIDEELLVQRGAELELEAQDRVLRNALAAAVLDDLVARGQARAGEPDDAALRAFYAEHRGLFASPERVRVRQRMSDGSAPLAPLPDGLLSPRKLRDYLGASALAAVLALEPGESTAPLAIGRGARVLTLVERVPGQARSFEDARDEVAVEYRRRAGEDHVRAFLAQRRRASRIAIASERL